MDGSARSWQAIVLVVTAVGLCSVLTGCAGTTDGLPSGSAPSATASATSTPASASLPCAQNPGCDVYRATFASDRGAKVAWITGQPISAEVESLNGSETLVVDDTCNAINLPLRIDGAAGSNGTALTIDRSHIAVGAVGCAQNRVRNFVDAVLLSPTNSVTIDPKTKAITFTAGTRMIVFTKS